MIFLMLGKENSVEVGIIYDIVLQFMSWDNIKHVDSWANMIAIDSCEMNKI